MVSRIPKKEFKLLVCNFVSGGWTSKVNEQDEHAQEPVKP